MGCFTTKLTVWNPRDPSRFAEMELWVDTGAAYSWIARSRLEPLDIHPTQHRQFRTIEGHLIERDMAPVFLRVNGYTSGDNVVMAEAGDMEVLGAFTLEGLGLSVDVVQKKLVPVISLALAASGEARQKRQSHIVEKIDGAISAGTLCEPFSNNDFRTACAGFGEGTYNAFLWKHSRGNPGGNTEFFIQVGKNLFRRIRD